MTGTPNVEIFEYSITCPFETPRNGIVPFIVAITQAICKVKVKVKLSLYFMSTTT